VVCWFTFVVFSLLQNLQFTSTGNLPETTVTKLTGSLTPDLVRAVASNAMHMTTNFTKIRPQMFEFFQLMKIIHNYPFAY